jgi:leucyl-tRNA synthetase
MSQVGYNTREIERKWQERWETSSVFNVKNANYFVLSMWPYPSGKLHMGHLRNYLLGDVIARFKTMKGFNVLHPMGWDAFGLPAENAAIEKGTHPEKWTLQNIAEMKSALKKIGFSFNWEREETSCLPNYYKHEQKMFIDFLKNGIAYKKESLVNWDPVDNTVLANEQVIDGKGWRSGAEVEKRLLSQWFLKISDFSEELLEGLKGLSKWPEKVRFMQENWIGKSEGAEVDFALETENSAKVRIFTTRPETLHGASFIALSYGHELAKMLENARDFVKECEKGSTKAEDIETMEKKGFFTGLYAINPVNNERVPVYIANFVLMDYGTGALFGCPAHDERDYEFATKYGLPIKKVVEGGEFLPFTGFGKMVNSGDLNGLNTAEAKEVMLQKFGRKVNFRLKDWGVSRQRYWGCPIPIVNCQKCGSVPVKESDLPVLLPKDISFEVGENPLKKHPTWKNVNCPACEGKAERETDTLDTFFESSWYFLRFSGEGGESSAFQKPMPVNDYIGGIEHAILHLLYARFFNRALKKCGYPIPFDEPFERLITQGMVCHKTYQTLEGKWLTPEEASTMPFGSFVVGASIKMSKSKKNVIEPATIVEKFGADTARFFIASDNPPERDMEWSEEGVASSHKFLNKIYGFLTSLNEGAKEPEKGVMKRAMKLVSAFEKDIENVAFNKAIARIRELSNEMFSLPKANARFLAPYLTSMLIPFTPHLACEVAELLGFDASSFPKIEETLLEDETCNITIQVNGKVRGILTLKKGLNQEEVRLEAMKDAGIIKHLEGKEIKKEIFVKEKLMNFVL